MEERSSKLTRRASLHQRLNWAGSITTGFVTVQTPSGTLKSNVPFRVVR